MDDQKITENPAPGQGESRAVQIEKALLWREVQRIREQIVPHMIAIVNAFPAHKLGSKSSNRIGAEIGKVIGYGIASHSRFCEESVFGAYHLQQQLDAEDTDRMAAALIDSFLKRVDEIGEIAEDAASRVEG